MLRQALCRGAGCLLLLLPGGLWGQTMEATTVATAGPAGVAYDASGNLYVTLQQDHMVVMVDSRGVVARVAGTGEQGFGGDGGAAGSALLDSPSGIAFDSGGNLYIADTHNNRVREVSNGVITTVAGTGVAGFGGDGGAASAAQLSGPTALSVDASGDLYVADSDNHRIRLIAGGTISTVAGNGEQGFSGDGGAATAAGLDTPNGVAADPSVAGRFYVGDTHDQRIRVVDAGGNISTLAGTGVKGFGGDGGAAAASLLDRPRGLSVDASSGTVYLVDSDNNRVRAISGGAIGTVAGTGEQGFSGDTGAATAAVLDTPTAVAVSADGPVSFSDTHNQRTRSVSAGAINTVVGAPPAGTEGIVLSGAITGTYGSGSLTAMFSNRTGGVTGQATGMASLLDGGVTVGSASFSGNQAMFDLSKIDAGAHSFAVAYGGDVENAPTASGVYLVTIAPAAEAIDFPAPTTPVIYAPGSSVTLNATASSGLPVTYTVTGPATVSGSTLNYTGGGTVVVTAAVNSKDYVPVAVSRTITVEALLLSGVSPATATIGDPTKVVTVTGTAFVQDSMVLLNGTAVATTYANGTTLMATIPAADFVVPQTLQVSVLDPTQGVTSNALPFTVTTPGVGVTVSAPATSSPGTQPGVTLTLANAYPIPVAATLTLTFTPGANGVDDPNVVFSNGLRTITVDVAAGQTTVPAVQIQTGTVSGSIAISLTLSAGGMDVTPTGLTPTVITVPTTAPSVSAVAVTRSGKTLTVEVTGYSDTRQITQAAFHFTGASGEQLGTKDLTVDATGAFTAWFGQEASTAYGSEFSYSQVFELDQDASVVGQVTVTLTNSAGTSAPVSSPQ